MQKLQTFLTTIFLVLVPCLSARALPGDLNCDGQVSFKDINPFVLRLSAPESYFQQYPDCPPLNGDMNEDGQVSFLDINRFVSAIVACGSNTPPQALAEADPPEVAVGEPVSFDGSGSLDLQDNIDSYSWNFADGSPSAQGEFVTHTYTAPGSYEASLTVADQCGASASDSITIVVQAPDAECQVPSDCSSRCTQNYSCIAGQCIVNQDASLCADFRIEQVTGLDSGGNEVWSPLQENDSGVTMVERGLHIRLNATYSTGALWYEWWQNYSCIGVQAIINRTYTTSTSYTIRLVIYNQDGTVSDETSRAITVQGMSLLSIMPTGHRDLRPKYQALNGNDLFAVSWSGEIYYVNISDPYNLPPAQTLAWLEPYSFNGMEYANGRVYIPRASEGLNIYNADKNNFYLIHQMVPSDYGMQFFYRVVARDDYIYVIAGTPYSSYRLMVFNMVNPVSPTLVKEIPLTVGITPININNKALIISTVGTPQVFDIRNFADPVLLEADIGGYTYWSLGITHENTAYLAAEGGSVFLELIEESNGALSFRHWQMPGASGPSDSALYKKKFFHKGFYVISKRDLSNATNDYQMEEMDVAIGGISNLFVREYDGDGPLAPVLFAGFTNGYQSFNTAIW